MIVVDASVVAAVLFADADGARILQRLGDDGDLYTPELMDVEVLHVFRRVLARGEMSERRAEQSLALLGLLPITRVGHSALRGRIWQLRENLSAYDAAYVALAEGIGATLLTRDQRLGRAPGIRAEVEVV